MREVILSVDPRWWFLTTETVGVYGVSATQAAGIKRGKVHVKAAGPSNTSEKQ